MRKVFGEMAEDVGAKLSNNADKILAIKARAIDEYACPCYPNDINHWCISPLCMKELNTNGRCHCGLFVKDVK
jgi:ferredoxin-thioredoxin reductase catalytic subunit